VPSESTNRLGLTFAIDNNIIGNKSDAIQALHLYRGDGWIDIVRADTTETELADAPDDKRYDLLSEAQEMGEDYGVMRLDHSRLGSSVLGSTEDDERFDRLFTVLKPGVDRATARRQHLRDVMHVDTAIRYDRDGFITRDEGLLKKSEAAWVEFGIRILTPEQGVEVVEEAIEAPRR
jgi:hypothetical protein